MFANFPHPLGDVIFMYICFPGTQREVPECRGGDSRGNQEGQATVLHYQETCRGDSGRGTEGRDPTEGLLVCVVVLG